MKHGPPAAPASCAGDDDLAEASARGRPPALPPRTARAVPNAGRDARPASAPPDNHPREDARTMRIATWNVNSLNVRLPHVLDWLDAHRPDVLMLQETKLTDDRFPVDEIRGAGYHAVSRGRRRTTASPSSRASPRPASFAGSRGSPASSAAPSPRPWRECAWSTCTWSNGQAVGSEKYAYKLEWMRQVTGHLRGELREHPRLVVAGDFNVAPEDRDVHDPEAWKDSILCSDAERDALARSPRWGSPTRSASSSRRSARSPGGITAPPRSGATTGCGST